MLMIQKQEEYLDMFKYTDAQWQTYLQDKEQALIDRTRMSEWITDADACGDGRILGSVEMKDDHKNYLRKAPPKLLVRRMSSHHCH